MFGCKIVEFWTIYINHLVTHANHKEETSMHADISYTHKITGCHSLENYSPVNYTFGGFVGLLVLCMGQNRAGNLPTNTVL